MNAPVRLNADPCPVPPVVRRTSCETGSGDDLALLMGGTLQMGKVRRRPMKGEGDGVASRETLERAITGALRDAIHAHTPITPDRIGSAVKRVVGGLRNVRIAAGR